MFLKVWFFVTTLFLNLWRVQLSFPVIIRLTNIKIPWYMYSCCVWTMTMSRDLIYSNWTARLLFFYLHKCDLTKLVRIYSVAIKEYIYIIFFLNQQKHNHNTHIKRKKHSFSENICPDIWRVIKYRRHAFRSLSILTSYQ